MEGEDDVRIRWKALEQEDLDHGNPLGMGGWVKGWWGCCEVLLLFRVFKQMFFILLPDTCGLEYPPQTQVFRAPNLLRSSFHKWSIILPPFFGRHHSAVAPGVTVSPYWANKWFSFGQTSRCWGPPPWFGWLPFASRSHWNGRHRWLCTVWCWRRNSCLPDSQCRQSHIAEALLLHKEM